MYRLMPVRYVSILEAAQSTLPLPPGSLYYCKRHEIRCSEWDDCPGYHLHLVLPNRHIWNLDQRASNCGRMTDRRHRCWARVGVPAFQERWPMTVWEGSDRCTTYGAGSVFCLEDGWHGFLRDGWIWHDPIPYPDCFRR